MSKAGDLIAKTTEANNAENEEIWNSLSDSEKKALNKLPKEIKSTEVLAVFGHGNTTASYQIDGMWSLSDIKPFWDAKPSEIHFGCDKGKAHIILTFQGVP